MVAVIGDGQRLSDPTRRTFRRRTAQRTPRLSSTVTMRPEVTFSVCVSTWTMIAAVLRSSDESRRLTFEVLAGA